MQGLRQWQGWHDTARHTSKNGNRIKFRKLEIMNKKFTERLVGFLDSEATDYGLQYDYKWDNDCEHCTVNISLEHDPEKSCEVYFKYREDKDDLLMELHEDGWETVREFDWTVKFFWMFVSPKIWSN